MQLHYLEFVSHYILAQSAALESAQGLSFGPPNPDKTHARHALSEVVTRVGVRAPQADHEQTFNRPYFAVDDIVQAVAKVEAEGATVAYPPTRQGDTGTWAIYLVGDLQIGLWQG